jgi:hypothetical protein
MTTATSAPTLRRILSLDLGKRKSVTCPRGVAASHRSTSGIERAAKSRRRAVRD